MGGGASPENCVPVSSEVQREIMSTQGHTHFIHLYGVAGAANLLPSPPPFYTPIPRMAEA